MKHRDQFTNVLLKDEKLLWTGQAPQGIYFRKYDLAFIPFSILWCGFVIFWELGVLNHLVFSDDAKFVFPHSIVMPLFGGIFVCIGLYMLIGRFFHDALMRKKIFYAITNKRALIRKGFFSGKIESVALPSLSELHLEQNTNGSGSIIFGKKENINQKAARGIPIHAYMSATMFEGIPKVNEVYELIESIRTPNNNNQSPTESNAQKSRQPRNLLKAQVPKS